MAKTSYQQSPPSSLVTPRYAPSPLAGMEITSRGTESKPVPPKAIKFTKKLKPAPSLTTQPGAAGTI